MTGELTTPKKLKVQGHRFVFNSATIGTFIAFFGHFKANFGFGVSFRNFFGTYLCRQSTLVWEAQP